MEAAESISAWAPEEIVALRILSNAALLIGALIASLAITVSSQAQSRFEGWSSVVIAGDWRDGRGAPIEAFDNARRDLSAGLIRAGLPQSLHQSLTLNPAKPDASRPGDAMRILNTTLASGNRGCLFYITSHGSPGKLVFGDTKGLEPADLALMLRRNCDAKPTVMILSACYSGSFVDSLRAPNRMILTAARRDRSSFGCGEGEVYPWFDACIIDSLPTATDFLELALSARTCVAEREKAAGIDTPSEPQLFVGSDMQFRLPVLRFSQPSG